MAISLQKGQRVSLSKESKEGLDRVIVGLGWDEARQPQTKGFLASLFGGGEPQAIDCDASALLLQDGKLRNWKDVVYFGALRHGSGAVQHQGDNLTGAEDLVVKMDDYQSNQIMCGLVLLENVNDETFSVEKIVQFYRGHQALDQAFGWGMRWTPGRK